MRHTLAAQKTPNPLEYVASKSKMVLLAIWKALAKLYVNFFYKVSLNNSWKLAKKLVQHRTYAFFTFVQMKKTEAPSALGTSAKNSHDPKKLEPYQK